MGLSCYFFVANFGVSDVSVLCEEEFLSGNLCLVMISSLEGYIEMF